MHVVEKKKGYGSRCEMRMAEMKQVDLSNLRIDKSELVRK